MDTEDGSGMPQAERITALEKDLEALQKDMAEGLRRERQIVERSNRTTMWVVSIVGGLVAIMLGANLEAQSHLLEAFSTAALQALAHH
jgi:hypothetical protein